MAINEVTQSPENQNNGKEHRGCKKAPLPESCPAKGLTESSEEKSKTGECKESHQFKVEVHDEEFPEKMFAYQQIPLEEVEIVGNDEKQAADDNSRQVIHQTAAAGHMSRWMWGKSSQTFTPQKCEPSVQMGVAMPARR